MEMIFFGLYQVCLFTEVMSRLEDLHAQNCAPDSELLDCYQGTPSNLKISDGLPLITSQTVVQMSVDIQDPTKRKSNPAIVVVVDTLVAHFLLQKLMSSKVKTGLEAGIQKQITAYFATAQAALSQINILATPCLQNIQALIFGVIF